MITEHSVTAFKRVGIAIDTTSGTARVIGAISGHVLEPGLNIAACIGKADPCVVVPGVAVGRQCQCGFHGFRTREEALAYGFTTLPIARVRLGNAVEYQGNFHARTQEVVALEIVRCCVLCPHYRDAVGVGAAASLRRAAEGWRVVRPMCDEHESARNGIVTFDDLGELLGVAIEMFDVETSTEELERLHRRLWGTSPNSRWPGLGLGDDIEPVF